MHPTGPTLPLLRPPETLLDTPGTRLSHGGVLDTPAGLLTVLALEHRPVPPQGGAVSPWLVYLTMPGRPYGTLALPRLLDDQEYGVQLVICQFGQVAERRGLVLVMHHAFLPRSVGLFLDAAVTPSPAADLLAEPALLEPSRDGGAGERAGGAPEGVRVWHSGVLRVGGLLYTRLEATADRPGLLVGPAWDPSPRRPADSPPPLEVRTEPPGGHRHFARSWGEEHSAVDAVLLAERAPLRLDWTCHPLGMSNTRALGAG
ncbi:hypothetical protein [Kitasatospora sp. NPDC097691]|uniref:hypothetical protein n=1 Tax=Kitasatospora sp. NPDC097691 TaxID=3157231 RepID=UPI00333236E0